MGMDEVTIQKQMEKRRSKNGPVEVADWGGVTPDTLIRAISIVSSRGGALRFGYTRDGGAYAVGVYYGGEYFTDYIRPYESIDNYLDDLRSTFESADIVVESRGNKRKK